MYVSSVSLPVSEPWQTLVSIPQFILCGYDNISRYFYFFFVVFSLGGGAVEECLICLIDMVVKLPTGFEALVPPLKHFTLGSVFILDGASVAQMLKVVGVSTVQ